LALYFNFHSVKPPEEGQTWQRCTMPSTPCAGCRPPRS